MEVVAAEVAPAHLWGSHLQLARGVAVPAFYRSWASPGLEEHVRRPPVPLAALREARPEAGQGHLGLLVHVSQRLDLFGVRTAATLLVVTIVTTGEIVGATRVHRRPDAFLILDRGTGGAEDEAVDTGFAQHHVCDHFTLIQLSVPLDIKLEVEDRQYEKVFHSESINSDNSYSI